MPRLFVAVAVPDDIKAILRPAQSYCPRGCRVVQPEQWHITLQFIGSKEIEAVDECLRDVEHEVFDISLSDAGYFGRLNRGVTLWWGIQANPPLLDLQAVIQTRLQERLGCEVIAAAKGSFQPHITLARCKTRISRAALDKFLLQPPINRADFSVTAFGLYSSLTDKSSAKYTLEKSYPLTTHR